MITYRNTDLLAALRKGELSFTFTKLNDKPRPIRCTLSPDLIPTEHLPKGTGPVAPEVKPEDLTSVAVYDLDVEGWRTVIIDRIVPDTLVLD